MSWQLSKAIRKHSLNFQRRLEVFKTFFFQFIKRSRGQIKLDSEVGEIKLDNWGDHNFVLSRTSQLPAVPTCLWSYSPSSGSSFRLKVSTNILTIPKNYFILVMSFQDRERKLKKNSLLSKLR